MGFEAATGWIASSAGRLADPLDIDADSAVYGMALYVVGKTARRKTLAAMLSGDLQIGLTVPAMVVTLAEAAAIADPYRKPANLSGHACHAERKARVP